MTTLKDSLRRARLEIDNQIADAIVNRSELTYKQIGELFGVKDSYVAEIAKARKITRPMGLASPAYKAKLKQVV